jgi:hypothetical protein
VRLTVALLAVVACAACIRPVNPSITPDANGCPTPEPTTFIQSGVDIKVAQASYHKLAFGGIDVKANPQVISTVSKALADARIRDYLRCVAIKRDKLNVGEVLYLDLLNAFMATSPTAEQFSQWQSAHPPPQRHDSSVLPQSWKPVPIAIVNDQSERVILEFAWHDVVWVGSQGWLCGAREEGGGADQFVGRGILLYTVNGGSSWRDITDKIVSDSGQLAIWGQHWRGVGPITAIGVYPRRLETGKIQLEGWLASWTGIYTTSDAENGVWQRSTPNPSLLPGYAHFQSIANIEAFREIYAVGWQGIAHWVRTSGWEVELPTYNYLIRSVTVFGDTQRDVWAVGRAGYDENGRIDSDSRGAIYHLLWPENRWQQVPTGVTLALAQSFRDIIQLDHQTVLAVGDQGLIIRGVQQAGNWSWKRCESHVSASLNTIARVGMFLFTAGDNGTILRSADQGVTWEVQQEPSAESGQLLRIRTAANETWIVGDRIVLKQDRSKS